MKNLRCFILLFLFFVCNSILGVEQRDTTLIHLDSVVVTGSRDQTDVRNLPMTISVIGKQRLTENHQNNVLPTLSQQVPGLFVTSRGLLGFGVSAGAAGTIKVRGVGGMADLLVLIDGLPQYAGLYGHPLADTYQTMLADRVEVLRGPASMVYGSNAMGGVVNIVTQQMVQNGMNSHIQLQGGSYGTWMAHAVNSTRKGKFSSVAGAGYGRTDGHRPHSAFKQTNGFLKLGYDFTRHWALALNTNINYFESSNPGEVFNPLIDNDMMITRGTATVSMTNEYAQTGGALRMYLHWGHHHINDGYHAGEVPQKAYYLHDDRMGGLSLYQSFQLFSGNRATVGFDIMQAGGHAWNKAMADGTLTDIANKQVTETAGYVDMRQTITPWMLVDIGIRLDHHSVSGNEWIPQGGVNFFLKNHATLRAMVGKGFRFPTIRELFMYRPANDELKAQQLMNYELSYRQHLLENRLSIGANVFYLKAKNMIEVRMIDGAPRNVNTGLMENSGLEVEFDLKMNRYIDVNGNYSFLHMSRPQLAAPRHKLMIGAGYQQNRFRLNSNLQYIAGLYTIIGANEKKENYWLWNLTTGYQLSKKLQLFVKGENLLAQQYQTINGFPMPRATFMGGIDLTF
ncbi:MAG: TonB-dependent receptor [Prevotella sp.]